MKISIAICLGCVLVAVGQCQDLTALMFQAMGIEAPLLPPTMPRALREHLYPQQRRQQLLEQQQQQQQKQRYLSYLASQQQRQSKANPYSMQFQSSNQPRSNSVYSAANKIRYPGNTNSVGYPKYNPYSSSVPAPSSNRATSPGNYGNPYSVSRAGSSGLSSVRNSAPPSSMAPVPIAPQATRMLRTMQTLRAVREHPRRVSDAQSAGCVMPGDSTAVSVLMYNNCREPAARMVCQAEMMTCMNVGMSAMCCPFGINNFALDTIGYVNKLQHFVSELA